MRLVYATDSELFDWMASDPTRNPPCSMSAGYVELQISNIVDRSLRSKGPLVDLHCGRSLEYYVSRPFAGTCDVPTKDEGAAPSHFAI
jgi:hypothetical protein